MRVRMSETSNRPSGGSKSSPSRSRKRGGKKKFRSDLTPTAVRGLLGDPSAVGLMRALGLLTERGGASPDSHRKLKQLTHFLRLIEPGLRDVLDRYDDPTVVDAAAGKGYLGLVLAQLVLRPAGKGRVIGIEGRPELVAKVADVVAEMDLPVTLREGAIIDAELPERLHYVVALHACDTATDEAIVRGVRGRADHIAVVPCCQAEVSRQLADADGGPGVGALWGNAWHRREFGAHLTNVVRVLALRARGYQVTVTELAGWEHSLKNELILARRVARFHEPSQRELDALLENVPVRPWLLDALDAPEPMADETPALAGDPEPVVGAAHVGATSVAEGADTGGDSDG